MGVLDDIKNRRNRLFQRSADLATASLVPKTMTALSHNPDVKVVAQRARELSDRSEQARAAAAHGAVDAAKEQQWMTGQRRMNGDGDQYLQDGGQFAATPNITTRQMSPGGDPALHIPGLAPAQQQPTGQVATEQTVIPRRTHQTAGGGAMPVGTKPGQVVSPQQPQVADMNEMLAYLARDSKQKLDDVTETPEQKAAREKREKRQALMAKIGDGLGAFHEAYSYMMGNKPMTSGSLTAAQEARVKALGLERDKKYKDALDNYINVLETQRKNDYYNSIAETRRAEQESRDASRRSKEAREQEKLDLQKLLREDKQRSQSEKSSYWDAYWYARDVEGRSEEDAKRYASDYSFNVREQENANEQALNDAKVKKEQSATQKNQAQAAKAKAGGSRSSKKPTSRSNSNKKTNVKWK